MYNKKLKLYLSIVLLGLMICGCATSSNFYSAKTLDENKFAITFGADDILIKSSDKSLTVSKDAPLVPSLGAAYGLPFRLETGLRWYPPRLLEISLREQVNPPSFNLFDGSINLSYGYFFSHYSYLKYGISISKDIHEFEPYVHYSFYHFISATEGDFSDSFISGAIEEFINANRTIGLGIGLPVKKLKFYPEVDYQYFNNNLSNGLWHFGIGVRICTN